MARLCDGLKLGAKTTRWPYAGTGLRGSRASRAFEEMEELWSGNVTKLWIERAAWVPLCMYHCCWSTGTPPTGVRISLFVDFPGRRSRRASWSAFRDDARRVLRLKAPSLWRDTMLPAAGSWGAAEPNAHPNASGAGTEARAGGHGGEVLRAALPTLVWVEAAKGSNGRRILNEPALIRAVRDLALMQRPPWQFKLLRSGIKYADEIREVAGATVLVSLFGSALYNCRFMAQGATVIEIHGALKNDGSPANDYMYRGHCHAVGVRWVGYAPPGFRNDENLTSHNDYMTARVEPHAFFNLVRRILRGEPEQKLLDEYARQMRLHLGVGRVRATFGDGQRNESVAATARQPTAMAWPNTQSRAGETVPLTFSHAQANPADGGSPDTTHSTHLTL